MENQKVARIYLEHGATIEVTSKRLEHDLVVLASVVNTTPIPIAGLNYIPSKTRAMALAELSAGTNEVQSRPGNVAHVFLLPHSGLIFGTLVPTGQRGLDIE